ncbi:hypothetical protein IEN85_19470 [Pelagicoccus sp. NFK12]|uniref:Lipoprotein n=1 Tax=Pelagicoccus enzymogenes TaxID=2773457 RepID=A0A927FB98_9BACT|nr:hypothetical protein [Pelagicoccus enzymogenes]MBD5781689.1 hypothetical protein [Pelagicoccus enzymogenes]MDQ8200031.1 hypothetical protein [Pelagicoccus enzymogenes]
MNISAKAIYQLLAALGCLLALALSGCKTANALNSKLDTTVGKKHKVTNVHEVKSLPAHLRRVALLPLYKGRYDHIDMTVIEQNFAQELSKLNVFELITVEPEKMEELFGVERYSSVEVLPTKLLSKLHEIYAIDGVMLVDLTYYNAYQPVGMGVRAKLLDGHTGELVWAADETFDGASPAVSNAARKYFQTQSTTEYPLHRTQTVLHSTARFSKYVAHALFDTIQ